MLSRRAFLQTTGADEALWPTAPGYSPALMPPEQIMEGRKGERAAT